MRTGFESAGVRFGAVGLAWLAGIAILALLAGSGGCGYHLRGAGVNLGDLPPIMIQGGQDNGIRPHIRRILTTAGVQQVQDPGKAEMVIRLNREQMRQLAISVAADAKVREYELVYRVDYDLLSRAPDAPEQLHRDFVLRRIYSYDDTDILGKEEEKEQLEQSMLRAAAQRILRDLYTAQLRRTTSDAASSAVSAGAEPEAAAAPDAP
jgi:LPS-assembly lipoprotein